MLLHPMFIHWRMTSKCVLGYAYNSVMSSEETIIASHPLLRWKIYLYLSSHVDSLNIQFI